MEKILDIIAIGEGLIELSSDKGLYETEKMDKYYGGDSLCTVVAAQRLGARVGFITKVGTDFFKQYLLDAWVAENLDISQIQSCSGINGVYFIARTLDHGKELCYYRKKSAAADISIDDIDEDYIKSSKCIYTTGVTQSLSMSCREAILKSFQLSQKSNVRTAYDPNYFSKIWTPDAAIEAYDELSSYLDILFLNTKNDIKNLFGSMSPENVIKKQWDNGVRIIVVKDSERGGYLLGDSGEINFIPYYNQVVVDNTGAGDAFNGAVLFGLLNGFNSYESVKIGSIVAGLQSLNIGAIKSIPYKKEVFDIYGKQ